MGSGLYAIVIAALTTSVVTVADVAQSRSSARTASQVTVTGSVRDEAGAPVSGATVLLIETSPREVRRSVITDAIGTFAASVPVSGHVLITASDDEFGLQWSGWVGESFGTGWTKFEYVGAIPSGPVDLVLRRGVVLRGRAVDPSGRPFGGQSMFLVPAYVGSGPARIEALTDRDGRFTFPRAVLSRFEIVPRSLFDDWRPDKPGTYLRVAQTPDAWLATARAGAPIAIKVERYTLVPVTIDVSGLHTSSVQVWERSGSKQWGTVRHVDAAGRVQIVMEQGVPHELWVVPGTGMNPTPPWKTGLRRNWIGTPNGPIVVTIAG